MRYSDFMKPPDLFIMPFVHEEIGNSSYLIGSTGTGIAAVIDTQRCVDRYLQVAEGMGLRLAYAFEPHLHADFVSGARELATRAWRGAGACAVAAACRGRKPWRTTLPSSIYALGVNLQGVISRTRTGSRWCRR